MPFKQRSWRMDQAAALRQVVARDTESAVSIAVTSGKGGVGKSNVAVNLAIALADRGLAINLVDLDLGLANADVLLNVQGAVNLSQVIAGSHTLQEVLIEAEGVRFVPGASGIERLANLSEFERYRLLQQFQRLEDDCDFLILDLGAGVSRNVITFACAADVVLVVTTPEPTALTDAYSTIKMLARQQCDVNIELLVNQAQSSREASQAYERIAGVAGQFLNLPVTSAGYVLSDDAVMCAVRARQPFLVRSPRCNASACIRALAQKYARRAHVPVMKEGFFRRVAQMFQ